MKRFRSRLLSLVLAVIFLAATGAVAFAAPPSNEVNQEVGIESLQYLQDWGCSLASYGGGNINISGFTRAYQDVDYIMVRLYLQFWDGSKWVDLGSWLFENYNSSSVSGAKGLQVAGGYYYRARAEHSLTHNGTVETAASYSGWKYRQRGTLRVPLSAHGASYF